MTTIGKRPLRRIVVAAGFAMAAAAPGTAYAADADVNRGLADVRAITAAFHDEANAIAASC